MSDVPGKLEIGDIVCLTVRGTQARPWFQVFAIDGDVVLGCWPKRGTVRFLWDADVKCGFDTQGRRYTFVSRPLVEENTVWQHTNGGLYRVLFVTNLDNPREDHPPDVVYETLRDPARKWSRPLSDWRRSFTRHNGEPGDAT